MYDPGRRQGMYRATTVLLRDGRRVRLRRATPADAKAMIAHVNAVGAEGIHIMTERLNIRLREQREKLRRAPGRSHLYIVAVRDQELLGTADISRGRHRKDRHVAELGIALRKDSRGVGLGTAMMESMLDWARSIGIRKVCLGVFSTNRPALRMYRKLGFVQEGRLRGQVVLRRAPADLLLMSLWLRSVRR